VVKNGHVFVDGQGVAGILSGAAFFALFGGLLWTLWCVITQSARRSKQNVAVLDARFAAAATLAVRPAAPEIIVLRAGSKTSLGYAALLCFLALGCIGDFAGRGSGLMLSYWIASHTGQGSSASVTGRCGYSAGIGGWTNAPAASR
jgi:hypothetical protein